MLFRLKYVIYFLAHVNNIDFGIFYRVIGVRAILVEKDGAPKWKPSTLEEVTQADVDRYFSPLTSTPELTF